MLFAVVAAAAAAPQDKPLVKILSQSFDQDDQGSYQFAYELDNGQKVGQFTGIWFASVFGLQGPDFHYTPAWLNWALNYPSGMLDNPDLRHWGLAFLPFVRH